MATTIEASDFNYSDITFDTRIESDLAPGPRITEVLRSQTDFREAFRKEIEKTFSHPIDSPEDLTIDRITIFARKDDPISKIAFLAKLSQLRPTEELKEADIKKEMTSALNSLAENHQAHILSLTSAEEADFTNPRTVSMQNALQRYQKTLETLEIELRTTRK